MAKETGKKSVQSSQEIAQLMGVSQDDVAEGTALPRVEEENLPVTHVPKELPMSQELPAASATQKVKKVLQHPEAHLIDEEAELEEESSEIDPGKATKTVGVRWVFRFVQKGAPFLAVFIVGLVLYFFFFSNVNFNFGSLFGRRNISTSSAQNVALAALEKQSLSDYNQWISGFYYDVSNPKVLAPETDNSGNGLSNFQKYLLNLNPKAYDTLGLGMADSEALSKGINPLTGLPLTNDQQLVLNKYFDMEAVMNRLALNRLQASRNVAGAEISAVSGLRGSAATSPGPATPAALADQPLNVHELIVSTQAPAVLEIPSLKIKVPIIWTQDPKNFDADLQNGVVHYPGTALPGEIGTAYISGHSSNYVWAKGKYNQVFSKLGELKPNSGFSITATLTDGSQATFHYVITGSQEFKPTDQAQFVNGPKSVVALSTCWPVGATSNRLVVFGQLVQTDH